MKTTIVKTIENKSVVWFEPSNQYLVVETITGTIITGLVEGRDIKKMTQELETDLDIPFEKAIDFILDLEEKLVKPNMEIDPSPKLNKKNYQGPKYFAFQKFYKINSRVFRIDFSNEFEVSLIHPKFAHLECEESSSYDDYFQAFNQGNYTYLVVNDELIGSWSRKEIHYFQGKVSMQIIERIYDKLEENWMGVFHASAIGENGNSILLLGDSGNGKSTSLALLQAHGLKCVADDFVPIDNEVNVHAFPAGISIKKKALDVLLPFYPELQSSAEYHFERLGKIVRYLTPEKINYSERFPCTALVFIKYDPSIDFELEKVSNLHAFEKLIPDSWISPKPENVRIFLDWFSSLPCYQLNYSDNNKMIDNIGKIIKDEL